jgi:hypothetical protein
MRIGRLPRAARCWILPLSLALLGAAKVTTLALRRGRRASGAFVRAQPFDFVTNVIFVLCWEMSASMVK